MREAAERAQAWEPLFSKPSISRHIQIFRRRLRGKKSYSKRGDKLRIDDNGDRIASSSLAPYKGRAIDVKRMERDSVCAMLWKAAFARVANVSE